jgi:hypothetical protein
MIIRYLFLYSILIAYSFEILAQNSTPLIGHGNQERKDEGWNLDKYVFSNSHARQAVGDKPLIDFEAIDNWLSLSNKNQVAISRDGRYIAYGIQKHNYLRQLTDTIILQSTNNIWRNAFPFKHNPFKQGFFSSDSKQYIYMDGDSLCFIRMGEVQHEYVKGVDSYRLPPGKTQIKWIAFQQKEKSSTVVLRHLLSGKEKHFSNVSGYAFDNSGKWLACQFNNQVQPLVIYNINTGGERRFEKVADYAFSQTGTAIVLKIVESVNNRLITKLQYVSLPDGNIYQIWSAPDSLYKINSYNIDGSGTKVVFMVNSGNGNNSTLEGSDVSNNSIWYWQVKMKQAELKVSNKTTGINEGLKIQGRPSFTDNGKNIQFVLQCQRDFRNPLVNAVALDVWSYHDTILQSVQLNKLINSDLKEYITILNLENGRLLQIENDNKSLDQPINGGYAVVRQRAKAIHGDRFWEEGYYKDSCWLVSLNDGSSKFLVRGQSGGVRFLWFSPNSHYLLYFDVDKGCHYFSYDLRNGAIQKISDGIPDGQLGYKDYYLQTDQKPLEPNGIAYWFKDDKGLLVYDDYDIWQLDLTGNKLPANITNGYGYSHKTLFSLLSIERVRGGNISEASVYFGKNALLLKAFNRQNKFNGFYQKIIGKNGDPEELFMGSCFMVGMNGVETFSGGMIPIKAADSNIWVIRKETASEAPNYYVTRNFIKFTSLTNLQPQKQYNWLTTELHSFKQLDGTISQGVLFKPENFDSSKKYPIIIAFYKNLSDLMYQFLPPDKNHCPLVSDSPSWFVIRGYLVFVPDIYFKKGQYGPSTVNTLDGAAQYVKQLPFVDSGCVGAAGHSNSGRFGYYLLTHSNSFSAISLGSGAGGTNILSFSLSLIDGGESVLDWAEDFNYGALGAGGLGNLWQNKKSWLDHTAVLQADNVTSPLLLFHNKNDGAADPIWLAEQLFISLRRLEKKAWWLQYDFGGHLVHGKDAEDFTIRYTQFFDHYLKRAPAPKWMTEGIPARYKQVESRFELDPIGSCAMKRKNECKICNAWNENYKLHPEMFQRPISEWHLDSELIDKKLDVESKNFIKLKP